MKIYADNNNIIFKCDYCQGFVILREKAMNKRQFQTALNRFYREHDWSCEALKKRSDALQQSSDMTASLIKRIKETSWGK